MNIRHLLVNFAASRAFLLALFACLFLTACETTSNASSSSTPPSTPSSSSSSSQPSPQSTPSSSTASPSIPSPSSSSSSSQSSSSSSSSSSASSTPSSSSSNSTASNQTSNPGSPPEDNSAQSSAQESTAQESSESQGNEGFEPSSNAQVGDTGNNTEGTGEGDDIGQTGASSSQGNGDDPFADLRAGAGGSILTAAEKRAELDARLEESYGVFDGMILSEREKAQAEADEAGSSVMSAGTGGGGGGGDSAASDVFSGVEAAIIVASAETSGAGDLPPGSPSRAGDFENLPQEAFPIPEDIPSGNDDDVVARQLREAAMAEPDPELRERLWEEYRAYTGI